MKPAVSVIIPVYNVQEYIGECARSLFGQTLKDVEYIFVNDGTPDGSMDELRKVIAAFPQRTSAVKIVDKLRNEGLPAARRSGLELAEGEYIIHCDSDDWMEPNMLERMYLEARAYDSDAVVCAMFRDDVPVSTKFTVAGENCRDFILEDMLAVGEMVSLCRYMVKREAYSKGIEYPRNNQGEDHALMVQLAYYCKSIYCVRTPLYHWRTNMASITREPTDQAVRKRFEGAYANAHLVEGFLSRQGETDRFNQHLAALKLYCMFYLRSLLRKGEGLEEWRMVLPEIKGKVLCNKHIKFAHKVEYLMVRYCPAAVIKQVYRWRKNSR